MHVHTYEYIYMCVYMYISVYRMMSDSAHSSLLHESVVSYRWSHIDKYACTYIRVCAYTYIYMNTSICAYICIYICIQNDVWQCTFESAARICGIYIDKYACTYICIYAYTYIWIHLYVRIYVCICVYKMMFDSAHSSLLPESVLCI